LVSEIFDLKVADKQTNRQNSTLSDYKGRLKRSAREPIIMIPQFIRHYNMSMKSLQWRHTTSSCDECRTAPDGRRPL